MPAVSNFRTAAPVVSLDNAASASSGQVLATMVAVPNSGNRGSINNITVVGASTANVDIVIGNSAISMGSTGSSADISTADSVKLLGVVNTGEAADWSTFTTSSARTLPPAAPIPYNGGVYIGVVARESVSITADTLKVILFLTIED